MPQDGGTACPEATAPVFQDAHHAARTTHYGSLPQKSQHGRPQDENPVVHFFKNIVSGPTLRVTGWGGGEGLATATVTGGVSVPRGL